MSCPLSQGYNFAGCKDGSGGIRRLLITEYANVTALTITTNVVTAITMANGSQFREYKLAAEMGSFTDPYAYTSANGTSAYTPAIDFTIKGLTTSVIAELKKAAANTLIAIVEDNAGKYWLFGKRDNDEGFGMDILTMSKDSGKALSDFRGQVIHMEGKETDSIYEVNSGIITALLSAAA